MKIRHATALALVACLVPGNALAKCANSVIWIQGVVSGPAAGSTISVQVIPDLNWSLDPNGSPPSATAALVDADGQFQVTVYFDQTAHGTWRAWLAQLYIFTEQESCSREPETVTVQLHKNGQLVDQVALQFKRDFVSKDFAEFSVRSPVTLHSR
jgi:hypothetical protein